MSDTAETRHQLLLRLRDSDVWQEFMDARSVDQGGLCGAKSSHGGPDT